MSPILWILLRVFDGNYVSNFVVTGHVMPVVVVLLLSGLGLFSMFLDASSLILFRVSMSESRRTGSTDSI